MPLQASGCVGQVQQRPRLAMPHAGTGGAHQGGRLQDDQNGSDLHQNAKILGRGEVSGRIGEAVLFVIFVANFVLQVSRVGRALDW